MAGLRDLGREYLALQSAGADDEPIESARTAFKAAYERLVEKHGRLNDKPNVIAMRGDALSLIHIFMPFKDSWPKGTETYKVFTSKPKETKGRAM